MTKNNTLRKKALYMAPAILIATIMTGCGGHDDNDDDAQMPVDNHLMVSATSPNVNATNVGVQDDVSATFSRDVVVTTLNTDSFSVKCGDQLIPGTVSYDSTKRMAIFKHDQAFPNNTSCSASLTTTITDNTNQTLSNNYMWSFTTVVDTTPPTVVKTSPSSSTTSIATNSKINVRFSEDVDPNTITNNSFVVTNAGTVVNGTVSYDVNTRTATFTPNNNFATTTQYTATISNVKDKAGNMMANNYMFNFTTTADIDTTAPTITSLSPIENVAEACRNTPISITFSEDIDPTTLTNTNFYVMNGNTNIMGNIDYDLENKTVNFIPAAASGLPGTTQVTISALGGLTGIKDMAGNPLATSKVWTFTTSANACATQ